MAILSTIGVLVLAYAVIRHILALMDGEHYYQMVPIGVIGSMLILVDAFPNTRVTISILLVLSVMLLSLLFYAGYKFFHSLLYGDIEWQHLGAAIFSAALLILLFFKGIFI